MSQTALRSGDNLPFRWNTARSEQLGKLAEADPAEHYEGLIEDLVAACARVWAASGDCRVVFLGRSPESLYDLSRGLLAGTEWEDRSALMPFSMYDDDVDSVRQRHPGAVEAIRGQLRAVGLAPDQIAFGPRGVAIVDLVCSGGTFRHLFGLLDEWAFELRVSGAFRRRTRFVGVIRDVRRVRRRWRWDRRAPWAARLPRRALTNVSVPERLWDYLGNRQPKLSPSNTPDRWGTREMTRPVHRDENVAALALARRLYEHGRSRECRREVARLLCAEHAIRQRWLRRLVVQLLRKSS